MGATVKETNMLHYKQSPSFNEKAIILSKMIFFLPQKTGAHLQYACEIYAKRKFQTDGSKNWGGAD